MRFGNDIKSKFHRPVVIYLWPLRFTKLKTNLSYKIKDIFAN